MQTLVVEDDTKKIPFNLILSIFHYRASLRTNRGLYTQENNLKTAGRFQTTTSTLGVCDCEPIASSV